LSLTRVGPGRRAKLQLAEVFVLTIESSLIVSNERGKTVRFYAYYPGSFGLVA
jgi:hypothetical protein